MMKILVVCQYFYPEEFQINAICEELVKRGHEVTVLTGMPNYPTGILAKGYEDGKPRCENYNNVHVIRCAEIPRCPGKVGLAKNYLSFAVNACRAALQMNTKAFDVVFVYQLSPVLMALPGLLVRRKSHKKLYLYCCDLWPESVKMLNVSERSISFRVVQLGSRFIYRHCDRISVQSKDFVDYFCQEHGIAASRLRYIPQFAESSYLARDFHVPHEGFNFVFMGNIGIAQNLDCLVEAVTRIHTTQSYQIHIVGDGSYLDALRQLVKEKELDSFFTFYGRRPVAEMEHFYELADACLLLLRGDTVIGRTIPAKLQGYMAAGKPVVAAIDGAAQEVIRQAGCGEVVDASDYDGLASVMQMMIDFPGNYQDSGEKARLYFKRHFAKEQVIDQIEQILEEITGEN